MAVSYVASGNPSGTSSGTSRVIGYPAANAGDIVFLTVTYSGGYVATTISESGWTNAAAIGNLAWGNNQEVWYKRLTSAKTISDSLTISFTAARTMVAQIHAFRGVIDTGDPFTVADLDWNGSNSSSHTASVTGFGTARSFIAFGALANNTQTSETYSFSNLSGGTTGKSTIAASVGLGTSAGWYLNATSATDPVGVTWASTLSAQGAISTLGIVAQPTTTPVSQSFTPTWDVKLQTAQTKDVTYNVLAQTSGSKSLGSWNVRTAVTPAAFPVSYGVIGSVAASFPVSYGVIAQVAASKAVSYQVFAGTSASKSLSWNVKAQVASAGKVVSYAIQPYATPFVWGYQGAQTGAENTTNTPGQVFTAPVSFNKVEAFVATFGATSASAQFKLYAGATSTTVIQSGTATFGDNSWAGINWSVPRPAGTYRLEIVPSVGNTAWWSNSSDVFANAFATTGVTPVAGDRLFRITGATTAVSQSTTPTWGVVGKVQSSKTVSWQVLANFTQVAQSFAASYKVFGQTSASAATSWKVFNAVSQPRAVSFQVSAQTSQGFPVEWKVDFPHLVTTFAISYNVAARTSRTYSMAWDVLNQSLSVYNLAWAAFGPAATSQALTWRVAAQTAHSFAPSWNVRVQASRALSAGWTVYGAASRSFAVGDWQVKALATHGFVVLYNTKFDNVRFVYTLAELGSGTASAAVIRRTDVAEIRNTRISVEVSSGGLSAVPVRPSE